MRRAVLASKFPCLWQLACSIDLAFSGNAFMRFVRAFYTILELTCSGNCFLTSYEPGTELRMCQVLVLARFVLLGIYA